MSFVTSALNSLNTARSQHFNIYNAEGSSLEVKIKSFAAHKCYTLISFPANLVASGASVLAAAAGACTIGALKIAVFAISLGNVKLPVSTGIMFFGERAVVSLFQALKTIYEISSDIYNFCSKCINTVKKALTALGLAVLFNKIKEVVIEVLLFIETRIEKGFNKASESETNFQLADGSLPLLRPLNITRKTFVQDWVHYNDRSFKDITLHTAISVATLPLNACAAVCSTVVTVALGAAYVSKALLYAATNINIPLPTFTNEAAQVAGQTLRDSVENAGTCLLDIPITVYKVGAAIGINRVLATIRDVVCYIPVAVFTNN
ncbi:hypothetical protein COB11_02630 [Candidatus Aerophobetes bacterium]|uniref:Uncharacterized protein n=1 Tax=Aerophobetes bacterium TaxID=2030807 RepID=A0A2A4YKB2_UNCAE|nr:MAG: hypothetical protein COB11_02630 [Candidatus Aerophobetes bacterium]